MFDTLLVHPIFNFLILVYALIPGHDFGVAVIILTIVIRLIIWPLVTKQLHSQRAMQQLAPEIQKIRERAGGDKQKESQMLMELYKEKEISPLASFLPLLIQLPLFIALYIALRDAVQTGQIAQLTYQSLKNLSFVHNIIADPSSFKPTLFGLDMVKPSAILAVTAALAQFAQTKMLAPKRQPGQPAMPGTGATLYIFPLVTLAIGLRFQAALALYWTTTAAVALLQQYLVLKRDVVEMEEEAEDMAALPEGSKQTSPKKGAGKKKKKGSKR